MERAPTEYRMRHFARFFGCLSLAVLFLSGCTTGTAFDHYPGAASVLGFDKPERASSDSVPAAIAARDTDWDSSRWQRDQQ
jgi:hypothetical protein